MKINVNFLLILLQNYIKNSKFQENDLLSFGHILQK